MSDLVGLRPQSGDLIYRQRRPVRLWHWLNAVAFIDGNAYYEAST